MDLCANGIVTTPPGETGIFLICQLLENKDNACRYVKYCIRSNSLVMCTDKHGNTCINFTIDKTDNI